MDNGTARMAKIGANQQLQEQQRSQHEGVTQIGW